MSHQVPMDEGPTGRVVDAQAGQQVYPPAFIPDHQLLRCIGRGSYGEVWLARSLMGAYRAVKIVHRKSFTNERPLEREMSGIRKFEPISRSHEGFIDILQVGINEQEGCFYYVMELGDDQDTGQNIDPDRYSPKTLAKQISTRRRLSFQECLRLGLALSQAVGELHKRGLVHRDIKPSNIIFVNGVPKLADIGLVADIHEAASYVGTQGFIPPEGPGTPQADVYGLGKVLYEASTGKDRQDFPELPADWDRWPDAAGHQELNEVIVQACRAEVAKRYASALDLHAELIVLENGKSVKRLRLLERRLSALKHVAGVVGLVLLVLAILGREIYREWSTAVYARQQQVGANLANGNHAMDDGDLAGALPYFAEVIRLDKGREQEHRLRFGSTHAQCPKLVQMWFAPVEVDDVRFSPDGQSLISVEGHGKAQVFDVATKRPISPRFGQDNTLWQAGFSPDGTLAVTASEDGTACVWSIRDGKNLLRLVHPDAVLSACFSPDGNHILTSCVDGSARTWDAHTGAPEHRLKGHADAPLIFAAYSPDGHLIVTSARDSMVRIWDAAAGTRMGPPLEHRGWVPYAEFSRDNRQLVTACSDHKARVWDVQTGRQLLPSLPHPDGVSSVCFSPDDRLILTACLDHTARLWRADTHERLMPNHILRHSDRVTHAAFNSDGHRIATSCVDGTVCVWDLAGASVPPDPMAGSFSEDRTRFTTVTNQQIQTTDTAKGQRIGHLLAVEFSIAQTKISANGNFVAALSSPTAAEPQSVARVWDIETGNPAGPSLVLSNEVSAIAISNDGKRMLTMARSLVQTWDVATGQPIAQSIWPQDALQGFVFSPNSRAAAAWGTNGWIRVWDAVTGREFSPALKLHLPVSYAAFSPDSSRLVTCGADDGFNKCWAQVWDVATGQPAGPPLNHKDGVLFASFNAAGTRIATAGEDFAALVWEATTGRRLTPPMKHEEQVQSAIFSPDGESLVTASADRTARLWSTENGQPLTPPLRHLVSLADARFLGANRIITCDKTGTAWTWDLPIDGRPAEDLVQFGRLLTGDMVAPSGPLATTKAEPLAAVWQRLRLKYPEDFTVSACEIAAWHRFQAEESERQKQWFSAAFHLQALFSAQDSRTDIPLRLAHARRQLAAGE